MAIIDNNSFIGPKEEIFMAYKGFAVDLTDAGLEFQPGKSACYISEEFRTTKWDSLWGDTQNGSTTDASRNESFGLAVCNVPVGSAAFVKAYLAQKRTHTLQGFPMI
jgi:hypothetical protein